MNIRFNNLTLVTATSIVMFLTGCGERETEPPTAPPGAPAAHLHTHAAEGPHAGHLIELGNEGHHAELVHDETTKKITIYVLDGQAKNAHPIEAQEVTINLVVQGAPKQFLLPALPQPSDPAGQSSSFEIVNETLCDAICEEGARGRLSVKIAGKPYVGIIEHHDHEEGTHH